MKNRFYPTLLLTAALFIVAASAGRAQGHSRPLVLRIERGDTFGNLFGRDWQKAYEQNKVAVWRNGAPVSTPDILIEGMIVRVTPDMELTPRALARCEGLARRRAELRTRLDALEPDPDGDPDLTAAAGELRRRLSDETRFAADVEFVAHRLTLLENAVRKPSAKPAAALSAPVTPDDRALSIVLSILAAMALAAGAAVLFVRLRRPTARATPVVSGETRFQTAWCDVSAIFDELDKAKRP